MNPLPYIAKFNYPAIVIGIDPGLTMGVAVIRLAVIQKLIELDKETIVGSNLYDKGLHEGIITTTFKNDQTKSHIIDRVRDLIDKLRDFIDDEEISFLLKEIYSNRKKKVMSKVLEGAYLRRNKRNYTKICRDIFIVIETPKAFAPAMTILACVTGALFAAFPSAHKRVITRGSTLKAEALMMLMHRDFDFMDFWKLKSYHEIDAYMAAEWFVANILPKYYGNG